MLPRHLLAQLLVLLMSATAPWTTGAPAQAGRSVVLVTLDTTRADALGSYGAARPTPALDGLAARGLRYARALSASPLTLPSHATLLTGLEPPEHGVVDNGTSVLPPDVPTLATWYSGRGYATAAFVASRVLDRRFGLDRGFELYDDRMAAERTGEYGYPERDAASVSAAALAWLRSRPAGRPFFLWVHYYDAHAPYAGASAEPAERYAGEVLSVDRALGRLLAALPSGTLAPLVAVVGDHGEAFGEHGEHGHGLFLYEPVLRVPLILAGPGVPAGRLVQELVATRRLTATLLALSGGREEAPGPVLPGVGLAPGRVGTAAVFSETRLPASAYGWSPLRALTQGPWRYVEAPRPELYDLGADPAEARDLSRARPSELARLRRALHEHLAGLRTRQPGAAPDPEAARAVRDLGYLSGASGSKGSRIDPKDGLAWLGELDLAKGALRQGHVADALARLRALCAKSPGTVPFLSQLAAAELASDDAEGAVRTLARARDLNPRSEFVHLHLGQALRQAGRTPEARAAFERALELDPRAAEAWLALAEMSKDAGRAEEERDLLDRAAQAGTASVAVLTRLAQLELAGDRADVADVRLGEATALLPDFAPAWLLWGAAAERRGRVGEALARYERATALAPDDGPAWLHLGRLRLKRGDTARARQDLARAVALGPDSPAGREARRLLAPLP